MNAKKLDYNIFLIIIVLPFAFNWLKIHDIFSSRLSISIITVLLTVDLFLNFNKVMTAGNLAALASLVVSLMVTAMMYSSLGCVLTCYNIFVMAILLNNLKFEKKQIKTIHILISLLLGIYLLTLRIEPLYDTHLVYQWNDYEININSLGVFVLAWYFHFVILLDSVIKKKIKYILMLFVTAAVVYYIEMSESRATYMTLVVFFLLYVYKNFNMGKYKKLLLFALLIAIIFPFVYLNIIDTFAGVEIGGKSISSRRIGWQSAIDLIKQYPVFGSGTVYKMKTLSRNLLYMTGADIYTDSAHNVFLGLWKTVGFLPMILFALQLTKGENIKNITKSNIVKKKMFLSCIILCTFETILNDSNAYIFFMTLLLTMQENNEEEIKYDT